MLKSVLAITLVFSSASTAHAEDAAKQKTVETTAITLNWDPAPKTPKLESEMFLLPVQCGRGAPFLRVLAVDANNVPNQDGLVLLAGDNQPVSIDIAKATDVKEAHVLSYFATDSDVVVLVTGTDEIRPETRHVVVTPPPGSSQPRHEFDQTRNTAEPHEYILHYDFAGTLKSTHKMETPFYVQVVGEFESGQLLLGGMNDDGPQWAVANDDGTVRAFITLPNEGKLLDKSAKSFKIDGLNGPSSAASMLGLTQLVPYNGSLVVVARGDEIPLYIVNPGGGVQALKVKLPEGTQRDYGFSSKAGFYLKGYSKDKGVGAVHQSGELYAIDMATGAIMRTYSTGEVPVSSVVCADGNEFVALHQKDGATTFLRGSSN